MTATFNVGDEIPALTKKAFAPIDENARNPIHKDDFARDHGMRGALVPGSTLLSYALEMLYNYFGEKWFSHGKIKVSFIGGGAVNGDVLTAHGSITNIEGEAENARVHLEVRMSNQEGKDILVGEASCIR